MEFRNFDDPIYKAWRIKVYKRDFFTCRLCGRKDGLQAHHIRRWADYPTLRFIVGNGITLCDVCHANVKDREDEYAPLFLKLVGQKPTRKQDVNNFLKIKQLLRKPKA